MPSAKSSLASGTRVVGQIITDGDLLVEGQIEGGPVRVGGCLTVAAGATVQCDDAEVGEALVIGLFQGTLRSRDVVRIHHSGRVVGDILAARVVFVSDPPAATPQPKPSVTTPAPRPASAPPKPAAATPPPKAAIAAPAKPVAEAAPPVAAPVQASVPAAASSLPPPPAPPAPSTLSPGSLAMPHAAPPHRVPPAATAAPAAPPAPRVIPTLPTLGQRAMERKD